MAEQTTTGRKFPDVLTADDEKLIAATREEYLAITLSTERADYPRAEAAIGQLYRRAGVAVPPMAHVSSPFKACQAYAMLAYIDEKLLPKGGLKAARAKALKKAGREANRKGA